MSFNSIRAAKASREIMGLTHVKIYQRYCDRRAGNKSRHKIYVRIEFGNLREIIQMIQEIIKKNYPESFPQLYKGSYDQSTPAFVQIVWFSEREIFRDEVFKIILEDRGHLLEGIAG